MTFERTQQGQVRLSFSTEEFERLELNLGKALGETLRMGGDRVHILSAINNLHQRDPAFRPYKTTNRKRETA